MAYYSGDTVQMPMPQQYDYSYGYPQAPSQTHTWPPPYYQGYQGSQQAQSLQAQPYQAPPLPLKINPYDSHAQYQYQYQPYVQTQQLPPPPPPRPTIEPDPLPPHSNPQHLSPTQSRAYSNSSLSAPLRLQKREVTDTRTGLPQFAITKEAVHLPSFLSSKPLLKVTRCASSITLGTIRFHNMTTSDIELAINGREVVLSTAGFLSNKWMFQPRSTPNASAAWYWQKDKSVKGAVMLTDAKKHGRVLARIQKDILRFEKAGLSADIIDEITMTAIALAEHARRQSKSGEAADLGNAIADAGSALSGSHDGGSGGGAS